MKKIVSFLMCFVCGIAFLAGCSNNSEPFTQKNYTADGTQIKGVRVDVRDRQIEVSLSKDNQIHMDYFENNKEYYDISVSDENVLTMTAVSNKEWTDYIGSKPSAENRKIFLQIPNALLETLILSTTNEKISLSPLAVKESISVSDNGGNITFDKLDAGNTLTLTAKNGNISGTVIGSYEDYAILSEIKKGESNLPSNKDNGTKTLNVSNNNGDIAIEFVRE